MLVSEYDEQIEQQQESMGISREVLEPAIETVKYESKNALFMDDNWIQSARQAYSLMNNGEEFSGDDLKAAEYGYDLMQGSKWNISGGILNEERGGFGAAYLLNKLSSATPEQRAAIRNLDSMFENKDSELSDLGNALIYLATDPVNFIPFAIAPKAGMIASGGYKGLGKLVGKFGSKTAGDKLATRSAQAGSKVGKSYAAEGGLQGAFWGGAEDSLWQNIRMETGAQEEFSYGQAAESAAIAGAIGTPLGWMLGKLGSKSNGAGDAGKTVDNPVDEKAVQEQIDALPDGEREQVAAAYDTLQERVALSEAKIAKRVAEFQQEFDAMKPYAETQADKEALTRALQEDAAYELKNEIDAIEKDLSENAAWQQHGDYILEMAMNAQKGEVPNKPMSELGAKIKEREAALEAQENDPNYIYPGKDTNKRPYQKPTADDMPPIERYMQQAAEDVMPQEFKVHQDTSPMVKEDIVRGNLERMAGELQGGKLPLIPDPNYVRGESDTGNVPMVRQKSANPEWFTRLENVTIKDVNKAIEAVNAGRKLGKKQAMIIDEMVNAMDEDIAARTGGKSNLQSEIEAARLSDADDLAMRREQAAQKALEDYIADNAIPEKEPLIKMASGEYRGEHTAPMRDDFDGEGSLDNLSAIYGDEIYSPEGLRYYSAGSDASLERKTFNLLQEFAGEPDKEVTIYRAVPKGIKDINRGDWVAITKYYAKSHGDAWVNGGDYDIISKKVKASDIFTNGDSWHEWGYDPEMTNDVMLAQAKEYANKYGLDTNDLDNTDIQSLIRVAQGKRTPIIESLESNYNSSWGGKARFSEVESPLGQNLNAKWERSLGKRVVFYQASNTTALGMMDKTRPNTLFVNANSNTPFEWVVGHEFLHSLKQNDDALYADILGKAREYMPSMDEIRSKHPEYGIDQVQSLEEEWIADTMGKMFSDRQMLSKLSKDDPSLFKRLVTMLHTFIDGMKQKFLRYGNLQEMPATEYDRLMDILEDAALQHVRSIDNARVQ